MGNDDNNNDLRKIPSGRLAKLMHDLLGTGDMKNDKASKDCSSMEKDDEASKGRSSLHSEEE